MSSVKTVEVFKTNVQEKSQSRFLLELLYERFPQYGINFDLEDCDKVLRIEAPEINKEMVKFILREKGFYCAELQEDAPTQNCLDGTSAKRMVNRLAQHKITNRKILKNLILIVSFLFWLYGCKKDGLADPENNMVMHEKLSDYGIYKGDPAALIPENGYVPYEIPTQLYSDHAEKQRLVRIPGGKSITAVHDGLPVFPDGTILVKTFYYHHDKRDHSKGKKILETRLLIRTEGKWNVGTYVWNEEQNDARLLTSGINKTVTWIDEKGGAQVISFHIPGNRECATCHSSGESVLPLGPKIRNLNMEVVRNGEKLNQLVYFEKSGIMNPVIPSSFSSLPDSRDISQPTEKRARAYLDVNCGNCHHQQGNAAGSQIFLNYEQAYNQTNMAGKSRAIINAMSSGSMPRIGTTTVDEEGLALIRQYLQNL